MIRAARPYLLALLLAITGLSFAQARGTSPDAGVEMTALERVMEGKTVLAIAHRLSTIAQMDRIVVMAAGRICEAGNHAELLAAKGIYAGLWARQSGGFLPDA